MNARVLAALVVITCAAASPTAAQTAFQLRWALKGDVFTGPQDRGASRAVFTLTNTDTTPLPASGWALYFNTLLPPTRGTETGGVRIEQVMGELYRLAPTPEFAGLAPGRSVELGYATSLIGNISQAPVGPYLVFDRDPGRGYTIRDYVALPFTRPDQQGRPPRTVAPDVQFERNAALRTPPPGSLPPVFPTPVRTETLAGALHLIGKPRVVAPPELGEEAMWAKQVFEARFGIAGDPGVTVRLAIGPVEGQTSPDAYELTVTPRGIRIVGRSSAGVFYGVQSLRSLLPPTGPTGRRVTLRAMRIVDAPRFGYRGLHVDVARNFQPASTIRRVIDLMARYKLNTLHFHLTDDEGWRIEMPSLPELTTVGARRGHTLDSSSFLPPSYGSGPDVDMPYGSGFFTTQEYGEILKYAAARHIEVIPEIEMPGHARAAIKAMDARFRRLSAAGDAVGARTYQLSEADDRSVFSSAQMYHDNVMNPAIESTYTFIARVVEDLVAAHAAAGVPLKNLHVGGDEVPNGVWERSPAALAYLKANRLSSVDDLWFVFYGRVEEILKRHGLVPSGWEEMGVRKARVNGASTLVPNPGFANRGWRTYVWNNVPGWGAEDLAYRLANNGYRVVLSPVSNLYLDMAYNRNPEEPGLFWGGFVDIDKPFDFIPFDYYKNAREDVRGNPLPADVFAGKDRLTDAGRQNIIGIEACLWSETSREDGRYEYMLMPKLFGVAERAWAQDPDWARESDAAKAATLYRDAWARFATVVGTRELPRLDREGLAINYRIPTPGLKVVDGAVRANLQLPGFTLRYTTDGSEPTAQSPTVQGPIKARGNVRVAAFNALGRKGATASLVNR